MLCSDGRLSGNGEDVIIRSACPLRSSPIFEARVFPTVLKTKVPRVFGRRSGVGCGISGHS